MANCADYSMRVKGDYLTVIRFLHLLNGEGPEVKVPKGTKASYSIVEGQRDWIGRTGHDKANVAIVYDIDFDKGDLTGMVFAEIRDYAAWNVGGIVDAAQGSHHSIQNFCEVYGMEMEVFCREDGQGFSEYYYVDSNGKMDEEYVDHSDIGEGLKRDADGFWDDDEFEKAYDEQFPWDFRHLVNETLDDIEHITFVDLGTIVKETHPDWDHDTNYPKLKTNW